MINDKKKKDISFWEIICKITPMAFAACPIYFIIGNIVGVLHGLSHGFKTFMIQKFFDSVSVSLRNGENINKVILMAVALGLAFILSQILNGVDNFMLNNNGNIIIGYIGKKVNEKGGKLAPEAFDNAEYLDDIKRAKDGIESSADLLGTLTGIFMLYIPYFLFIGIYLYKLKPILVASLIIIFIPTVLTQVIRVKAFNKLADDVAPIRREYEYYESLIVDKAYFKETRLLGAFTYFKDLYVSSLKLLNKKIWSAERKTILMELGMKMITLLGYMGVLYLIFDSLIKGDISVGAFGAVFSSLGFMIGVMEEIICVRVGEITRNLGTVKNLIRFLEMPERTGKNEVIEGVPNISLKNVSFTYPGVNKASLSNISLEVKKGETIAIVGENGAGKTTLVKLMMGLYRSNEGTIFINGVDVAETSPKCIYSKISAVFQKYQRYNMTLGENIEISSLNNNGIEEDKLRVLQEVSLKADLEVNEKNFQEGYETMLSREFGGVDLSGGQWQRVAIARGFYRKHNMIVLDEPTAAIDPVEETKIYKKFAHMSKGKTAIIVTHRLGSAKIADRIVVMDKGQVVEIGNHEELMNKKGKYSEMYEVQSKWYINEKAI